MAYTRARADWLDFPNTTTPITQAQLDQWDQAIFDLKTLVFNVRDYGAVGNGSTNDTTSIQAAIDACVAAGGGIVYFPAGDYIVNSGLTITTTGVPVYFIGAGTGGSGAFSAKLTRLRRSSGTTAILTCTGTDQGSGRVRFNARDICFDGGGTSGDVVVLTRTSDGLFLGVTFYNATGTGLAGTQLWDSSFIGCFFSNLGTTTTKPAVNLTGVNEANGGCSLVKFTSCEWNGNSGTELKLTAPGTTSACDGVRVVSFKMERGNLGTYPMVNFDLAQDCWLTMGKFVLTSGSDTSQFVEMKGTGTGRPCVLANMMLDHAGSPAYFVEQTASNSTLMVRSVNCIGTPATKFFHIGSSVPSTGFRISNFYHSGASTLRFADDRAVSTVGELGLGYMDIQRWGGTAVTAAVGDWLVFDFPDAATNDLIGQLPVPDDVVPGSTATLRLWYTGSTSPGSNQVVVLNWNSSQAADGGSLAAGSTTYAQNLTIPSGFVGNTLKTTDIAGPTINAGQLLQCRLKRLGSDASDTYAGTWRLARAELVYQKLV